MVAARMAQWTVHDFPRDRLDPVATTGVILCGMGGPDGPDSVAPFLRNLFRDPAVLPLPPFLGRLVGSFIVSRRLKKVRERYASLGHGGGSPQLDWTRRQCQRLAELLSSRGRVVLAQPAMRYWHPFAPETVADLLAQGVRQFVMIPTYPQFSSATTGTTLAATCQAIREAAPRAALHCVVDWHLLPGYLTALAERVEPVLRSWQNTGVPPEQCALLPVAHSLPVRFIKQQDPYLKQTQATVEALRGMLAARLMDCADWWSALPGGGQPLLAFQSKVGPVRWLEPDSVAETTRLVSQGCKRLLVLPVSFTCEHIETLHELDVQLAAVAQTAGCQEFVRGAALNLDDDWLNGLAQQVATSAFLSQENRFPVQGKECHA
jgi:ferrochelatase